MEEEQYSEPINNLCFFTFFLDVATLGLFFLMGEGQFSVSK